MAGWTRATLGAARNKVWALMREEQPELGNHAPHNVLRHCHDSYWLSVNNGNTALLALQSGHSGDVMFKHYLNIVSKADAEKYWNLKPSDL